MPLLTTKRHSDWGVCVRVRGAIGDAIRDDRAAFQAALDEAYEKFAGGAVYVPPGHYRIGAKLTVRGATRLVGSGPGVTLLNALSDITVLEFTGPLGGMERIFINGQQSSLAQQNTVAIANGIPVYVRDCHIWGGKWALQNDGHDGTFDNCFVMGHGGDGGGILSRGSNFYNRMKLDTSGHTVSAAFRQGAPIDGTTANENYFTQCDLSGDFSAGSIVIADATNKAFTSFLHGIISDPVLITGAMHTRFIGCTFGSVISSSAPIQVTGSTGLAAITVSGAGAKSLFGNVNIS